MMRINPRTLPLKLHYFLYLGIVSPVYPFLMVIVKQLGIPIVVHGTVLSVLLVLTVFTKPFLGALADAFPKARKFIFLLLLLLLYSGLAALTLLPPMHGRDTLNLSGDLEIVSEDVEGEFTAPNGYLEVPMSSENCSKSEVWDCRASCPNYNGSTMTVSHAVLYEKHGPYFMDPLLYNVTTKNDTSCQTTDNLRFECDGGLFIGPECPSLFASSTFWVYILLVTVVQICYSTCTSIADAICMDTVGTEDSYGAQRVWGTIGWGLMGPLGGLLVDWWSHDTYGKSYVPISFLIAIMGIADLGIISTQLKIPRLESEEPLWKSIKPIFKPHVVVFLILVVLQGTFDGIIMYYIFALQEEKGAGTVYYQYMKLIQGSTLLIRNIAETPFMWLSGWLIKRLGIVRVTQLVFLCFTIRLFLLALAGTYGPVWSIMLPELFNGPCFGLGFAAVIVQAGQMSVPGTSATIQSVVDICYESIGYAICTLVGALMQQRLGIEGSYFVFGCLAFLSLIFYCFIASWIEKEREKVLEEAKLKQKAMELESEKQAKIIDELFVDILRS